MAASTASSLLQPPLSDRSNTLLDAPAPPNCSPVPPRHPPFKRHLFPYLDSSEATPSENSSLPGVALAESESEGGAPPRKRVRNRSRSRSSSRSGEHQLRPGTPNGPGVAVRFINRPDATPLTTILEQRSIATLRSSKSHAAVVHALTSNHANEADGTEKKQASRAPARRREAALSIDEATLRELHHIIDSQMPAAKKVTSGSTSECINDVREPARPISPPHPPYVRAQTPLGVPRWPGDLPASFGAPVHPVSRARSFGSALRDFFRRPRDDAQERQESNQTVTGGLSEALPRLQPRHARQSNHRVGLAIWAPLPSGHGSIVGAHRLGCHGIDETGPDEVTAETNRPRDPQAAARDPGLWSRPRGPFQKRDQDSVQGELLQPPDRQGPMQAPSAGSVQPNVTQAAHGQASRHASISPGHRQALAPGTGSTDSLSSASSSSQSAHSLIPAPLFTSPPHSRLHLDPRVPDSPYDRLAHVLGSGRQQPSQDAPSQPRGRPDRDDTATRYTAAGVPIYRTGAASLRSLDTTCVDGHRIVSVASSMTASRSGSGAVTSSQRIPTPSVSMQGSLLRRHSASPRSLSGSKRSPSSHHEVPSPSQPQTKPVSPPHSHSSSANPSGLTIIRSAALPVLLPIAASEGIVRPRPLPRPVTLPLTTSSDTPSFSAVRVPGMQHSSASSGASISASIRALRGSSGCRLESAGPSGSSDTFYSAMQLPPSRPRAASRTSTTAAGGSTSANSIRVDRIVEKMRHRRPGDSEADVDGCVAEKEEKSVGESLGWLLRVCFCQPVGGVDDGHGEEAVKGQHLHPCHSRSDVQQREMQQSVAD